jgi:DNA-binding transcriptional LysR family regulator
MSRVFLRTRLTRTLPTKAPDLLGRLIQPFDTKVSIGSYWLTALKSKAETDAMRAFRSWIVAAAGSEAV